MNLETLRTEAETALRPLSEKVRILQKHLAAIQHRAAVEAEKTGRLVEDIARLEAAAGEALGGSTNDYEKFKVAIRKLQARLAASKEIGELFHKKIIPAQRRELDAARLSLSAQAAVLYARSLPGVEAEMAEALAVAVAAHDGFLAAFVELGKVYDCRFPRTGPKVSSIRLDKIEKHHTRPPVLVFAAPPLATMPAAAAGACSAPGEAPPEAAPTDGLPPDLGDLEGGDVDGEAPPPPMPGE